MLERLTRTRYPVDHVLVVLIFLLAIFGLVMISSVSVYESHQVYIRQGADCGLIDANCNDFYFWRQARNIAVALPIWIIATHVPYFVWRRLALPLFAVAVALLVALLMPGLRADYGSASRWLTIPILGSVQPSEIAKIALIFYFARWMERREQAIATIEGGFVPFAIILGIVVGLFALQPDFGNIFVSTITATAIYFAAGARWQHIAVGGLVAIILGFIVVKVFGLSYIENRFAAWIDPSVDPEGIGYQVRQSLIAIGKGGVFGQGLEGATQRFGYLPEVQSDNIFAAISESFGFFGSSLLTLTYLAIGYRGLRIAAAAPDRFGRLAAVGLSAVLVGQAFVHIGVNTTLLPLTGITLPFVSYGGTSLLASFFIAGVLLNISKYANIHDASYYRETTRRK